MIYLDYNATTPVRPQVIEAMVGALGVVGNPSSIHTPGRAARAILERAREQVAAAVGMGAKPQNVLFTSGGTEASNAILRGWTQMHPGAAVAISAIEHEASLSALPDAVRLPVLPNGRVDPLAVGVFLQDQPAGGLLSVQWANNETGVIQPVNELAKVAKQAGWAFHCDAVQAFGKLPIDLSQVDTPDFISLSAHKLGGPKGVGALVGKCAFDLPALVRGGGQERSRRGGTENLAGIVGFGVAASLAADWQAAVDAQSLPLASRYAALQAACAPTPPLSDFCLANTMLLTAPNKPAAIQLMQLDLAGIAVSSGSACSSGKVGRSHVLDAMGYGEAADWAIRVSSGLGTTIDDLDRFCEAWCKIAQL